MKKLPYILLICFVVTLIVSGCSKYGYIPDKSVFEELTSEEISKIQEYEEKNPPKDFDSFLDVYKFISETVPTLSFPERMATEGLTYRQFAEATELYCEDINDSAAKTETQNKYNEYLPQAKQIASDMAKTFQAAYIRFEIEWRKAHGDMELSLQERGAIVAKILQELGYDKYIYASYLDESNLIGEAAYGEVKENVWNLERIITDKIDNSFNSNSSTNAVNLEKVKSKYPRAYPLLKRDAENTQAIIAKHN